MTDNMTLSWIAHPFDPGYTGLSERCNALVERDGVGDTCGEPQTSHWRAPCFDCGLAETADGKTRCHVCEHEATCTEPSCRWCGVGHDFVGVAGHPDDDECTHRSDGTDSTYCGLTAAAHDRNSWDDNQTGKSES